MPSEKGNILEFYQYMKSDKMPYIIYVDVESLMRKLMICLFSILSKANIVDIQYSQRKNSPIFPVEDFFGLLSKQFFNNKNR